MNFYRSGEVRTWRMCSEDLEAMLAREWGHKLQPVIGRTNKGRTPPRKIDANTVVFFPIQKAPMK